MSSTYILRKGKSMLADLKDGLAGNFTGTSYWLDPTNGDDGNDGSAPDKAVKTLPIAYALLADGKNDVLYYIPGTSSISLSAEFVWAKSYAHFVGVCAPTFTGQRARIFATAGDLNLDPLILISGSGCHWENIRVFLGVDDAQALKAVKVTGNYNSFINCEFAAGGHATCAVDGAASLMIDGGGENYFSHCSFGITTIDQGTGVAALLLDTNAKRNTFEDCLFKLRASNAGAMLVEVADATGIEDFHIFKDCMFIQSSTNQAISLTAAFGIPASVATFARMFMKGCIGAGFATWDANDRGILYGDMNDVTGADTSGVAVEMIS